MCAQKHISKNKEILKNKGNLEDVNNSLEKTPKHKEIERSLAERGVDSRVYEEMSELSLETTKNKEKKSKLRQGKEKLTLKKSLESAMDSKELKKVNSALVEGIEDTRKIAKTGENLNKTWGFKSPKIKASNLDDLKENITKYKKYNTLDAIKDAWEKTEYKYAEDGKGSPRGFFDRLISFFPALIGTFSSWKSFEKVSSKLEKKGVLKNVEKIIESEEEIKGRAKNVGETVKKGMEVKEKIHSSVFAENPGALQISKNYLKKLGNLLRNADDHSSPERAKLIKKYAKEAAEEGTKKYGKNFSKMKGFSKALPGVTIKQRGGFMVVEIAGKALGAALREGIKDGEWGNSMNAFKEEITNSDNWKDACPIWGSIRSAQRLINNTDTPAWSRWLDFGMSAGMDVAAIVAIVGSLGAGTPAVLAARSAGGALARGGIRKISMRQMMKTGARGVKQAARKSLTKKGLRGGSRHLARTAGGKWGMRLALMQVTLGEFFSNEKVQEGIEIAQEKATAAILTEEQIKTLEIIKAAKDGEALSKFKEK